METPAPWWEDATFDFIRIPKDLFRNPYYSTLSPESKLLYGFLLDRASLSQAQGDAWRTDAGDTFVIYTLREIQERLCCGKAKASRLLSELSGHHLIRRERPQKDGPYHIIVHPWKMGDQKESPGVPKSNLPRFENRTCPGAKIEPAQVRKPTLNNTENNNTERNNTHLISREFAEREIKKYIDYDIFSKERDKAQWDGVLQVMVDACCREKPVIVSGVSYPPQQLLEKFSRVDHIRVDYVIDRLRRSNQDIGSYSGFILARLLEPQGAVEAFYAAWMRQTV